MCAINKIDYIWCKFNNKINKKIGMITVYFHVTLSNANLSGEICIVFILLQQGQNHILSATVRHICSDAFVMLAYCLSYLPGESFV